MSGTTVLDAPPGATPWQPSLFGSAPGPLALAPLDPGPLTVGPGVGGSIVRHELAGGAWLDVAHDVVPGPDALFEELRATAPWRQVVRPMYDRMVDEPRLTTGRWGAPPLVLRALAERLSAHYGLDLSAVSANLYRDGRDSVAWHGDRTRRGAAHTVVAILSLGSPRRFLLRPRPEVAASGAALRGPLRLVPGPGDLLVMGGTCQRTWEHAVPKCVHAGPRLSVMFREPGAQDD